MRLKELQIKEDATAGATASGNIATVVNPHVANPSRKSVAYTGTPGVSGKGPVKQYVAKKQKPTDNALDGDALLMSSKDPQMIRRQIKEGSAYILNEKQLNELWPALASAALVGYGIYKGGQAVGKWMGKEKSKTQIAHNKRLQDAGLATPTPKKKKKTDEDGKWGTPKPSGKWGVPKPGASNKTNEGIKIKYRDPPAGIGGGPTKTAPTDDFSIGGRFDPKPGLGNVEGIPKPRPNIDAFGSKFKVPPKDPKPSFGDVEGQKPTKKPKKIVSTTGGGGSE